MRLIDADELLKRVEHSWQNAGLHSVDYHKFKKWVHLMPTIEAQPIKHGRWLIGIGENGEPIGTYCSECGWSWERNIAVIQLNKVFSRIETPRCPYCGAKMDEVEE